MQSPTNLALFRKIEVILPPSWERVALFFLGAPGYISGPANLNRHLAAALLACKVQENAPRCNPEELVGRVSENGTLTLSTTNQIFACVSQSHITNGTAACGAGQHTPGPWQLKYADGRKHREIWDREDYTLATVYNASTCPEQEANARLAAAPDLLNACHVLLPLALLGSQNITEIAEAFNLAVKTITEAGGW